MSLARYSHLTSLRSANYHLVNIENKITKLIKHDILFLAKKSSCIKTKAFRILYQQSNLKNVSIFDQVDMCGTQYYLAHIRSQ